MMTIREALLATVGVPVDDGILNKALADVNIQGEKAEEEYDFSFRQPIDVAAIHALIALKSIKAVHEGTNIVMLNLEGINAQIMFLAKRANRPDLAEDLVSGQPKISDVSYLW